MYFIMTIDVESFSIPLNKLDYDTGRRVSTEGLPLLLDILAKYDVKGTFYFTGEMAENFPESLELVLEYDHEIGCHSYSHTLDRALDNLSYTEQLSEIGRAKNIIERIAGKIESFRAPMLRINKDTVKILELLEFKSDSSIASQRFDGLLTFGSMKKLGWLVAPRRPYFLSYESPIKSGNSNVLEIPISALIFPYIGTFMRASPNLFKILQKLLFIESKITDKPIVFLFHPNECLDVQASKVMTTRRARNIIEYIFADFIRQRIKLKNLGKASLKLLNEVLYTTRKYEFEFICIKDYRKRFRDRRG